MILLEIKKKGQFKARPLKKQILAQPINVPAKIERVLTTDFKEFNLNTAQRSLRNSSTQKSEQQEEAPKQFKALTLNRKIL